MHVPLPSRYRARRLFGAASSITITGKNFATVLALNRFHHSPTCYRSLLDRVKDQALKSESNDTNNRKTRHHHVGIEKLLGVENHPPQSPIRGGDHLAAYHSDPHPKIGRASCRERV